MQLLNLAILFVPLVSALAIVAPRPSSQNVLVQESSNNTLFEKVPGDNPAYFTREKKDNQLFWIEEFQVSPWPPINERHIFFWLIGEAPRVDGLEDATIELHINLPDHDPNDEDDYFFKCKIYEFPLAPVRDPNDRIYGGSFRKGRFNEMIGDLHLLQPGLQPGHGVMDWVIEVVARLPDDRILFSFQARVTYEF